MTATMQKSYFLEWKLLYFDLNLLKFVANGPIDNIPALIQIMTWRQIGDKPLSETMVALFTDGYVFHSAWMSLWKMIQEFHAGEVWNLFTLFVIQIKRGV